MGVAYILNQVGNKMGLDPSIENQRSTLLRFLNEAADELYTQADVAGTLGEQVFLVNGDNTIALPYYVGQLRGIREYNTHIPWHVRTMRTPRYNVQNWQDMWRGYRIKGWQALMQSVTNESQCVLEVAAVESPAVEVSISGPTTTAANATEVVVMDATIKTTVNEFIDVVSLTKNRANAFDITLKDADGNTLTTLPNDRKDCRYMIVDVSDLPWSNTQSSTQDHYVEILFKKALPYLSNDADEYPAVGYDNILVNKMMQLWCEEQGKVEEALAYDQKATRGLARKHEEQNRATEDTIALVTNGHDELFPSLRANRPARQAASLYPFGVS